MNSRPKTRKNTRFNNFATRKIVLLSVKVDGWCNHLTLRNHYMLVLWGQKILTCFCFIMLIEAWYHETNSYPWEIFEWILLLQNCNLTKSYYVLFCLIIGGKMLCNTRGSFNQLELEVKCLLCLLILELLYYIYIYISRSNTQPFSYVTGFMQIHM